MKKNLALHHRCGIVDKATALLFHLSDQCPVSKISLVSFISHLLRLVVIDLSHYSGQSFRIGGATSASLADLTDYEIKLLRRWTVTFVNGTLVLPSVVPRNTPQDCPNAHCGVSLRHSL